MPCRVDFSNPVISDPVKQPVSDPVKAPVKAPDINAISDETKKPEGMTPVEQQQWQCKQCAQCMSPCLPKRTDIAIRAPRTNLSRPQTAPKCPTI